MRSMSTTVSGDDRPVLLMGASGRLGGMLRRHWSDPRLLRPVSRGGGPGMIRCDPLSMPDALVRAAEGCRAVICLSGVTPAHAAASGDAMALNTDLALAALRAAPAGARVFVASTAAVYGRSGGFLSEDAPTAPVSDYGRAKVEMESRFLAEAGGRGCILRIGNVAGADAILGNWAPGMQIDSFADGSTPTRSYIGPVSLARVLETLTRAEALPAILNIAAPEPVQMGALLDAADLAWTPRTPDENVIAEVVLDTTRLQRLYDFSADETTPAGLVAQARRDTDKGSSRT
ncbi:NAD-dependent epimerase/dehydratase family protein [Sulfitobacter sp. HNIBRBA3233]|uniref:NAD-dependent epimerase/dehydratase family protein n=1 Tax=Sulfitobacter marinivivus TaxID=3158558 RepID=UPI0032DF7571